MLQLQIIATASNLDPFLQPLPWSREAFQYTHLSMSLRGFPGLQTLLRGGWGALHSASPSLLSFCRPSESPSLGTWDYIAAPAVFVVSVLVLHGVSPPCPPAELLLIPQDMPQRSLFCEASPGPGRVSISSSGGRSPVYVHYNPLHSTLKLSVWEGLMFNWGTVGGMDE